MTSMLAEEQAVDKVVKKEKPRSKNKTSSKHKGESQISKVLTAKGPPNSKISKCAQTPKGTTPKTISKVSLQAQIGGSSAQWSTKKKSDGKRKKKSVQIDTIDHSKTTRLLHENDILMSRFVVDGMLAGGGFGQVYLGTDKVTGQKCAIKAQTITKEQEKRIQLEMLLYTKLRGKKYIPLLMAVCPLPNHPPGLALIMQLVGRSLADVRRQMPHKKLSQRTLYRAMRQVLVAISFVHNAGFLHRDVKPPNCCLGVVDITRIYLLDFGLCRQYIDGTGMIRRARKETPFRGTLRYVSLSAHARKEFGPCNDLIAFLYSTIELGYGRLPWSQYGDTDKIVQLKSDTTNEDLCQDFKELLPFADTVTSLEYDVIPDYDLLFKLFDNFQPDELASATPYDWEIIPCELELKLKVDEGNTSTPERIDKN